MLIDRGTSRSFPAPHASLDARAERACRHRARRSAPMRAGHCARAKPRELRARCSLSSAANVSASMPDDGSNVLGFARFRLGDDPPSDLVELVRQPASAGRRDRGGARRFFAAAGLEVALCNDFAGRIIDRLVRPYFNAALHAARRGAGDGRRSRPHRAARPGLSRRGRSRCSNAAASRIIS